MIPTLNVVNYRMKIETSAIEYELSTSYLL